MSLWTRLCNLWWLAGQVNRTYPNPINQALGYQQATIVEMHSPLDVIDL